MSSAKNSLKGRVVIVTGGSRGIGRECCLALARKGCHVVIAAKTVSPHPTLPGTIFTVAAEVNAIGKDTGNGATALAVKTDLTDPKAIQECVDATIGHYGRIDILINNASALWWKNIVDTPTRRYDLIHSVNVRGTFLMTRACLPHMEKGGFGRVVTMSPPITTKPAAYAGHTMYNSTKMGMTMVALGVAAEYKGKNITGNSLWPATIIESLASINFKLGNRSAWRKATILADAVVCIVSEPGTFTGNMLIDDTYLRSRGYTSKDLAKYRCDPNVEPPRLLAYDGQTKGATWTERGSVHDVDRDIKRSKL